MTDMMKIVLSAFTALSLVACDSGNHDYDASGTFEATESIISAETNGVVKEFTIEEGQTLKAGQYIGYIDSTQLYLKKKQLESQVKSLL